MRFKSTKQRKAVMAKVKRTPYTRVVFYGKVVPKYRKTSNIFQRTRNIETKDGKIIHIYEKKRGRKGKIIKRTQKTL